MGWICSDLDENITAISSFDMHHLNTKVVCERVRGCCGGVGRDGGV